MTELEFEKYFHKNFKRTSSLVSGLILMIIDALIILLCIGIGFFIVNLINHSLINFRSFVTYWIYLPAIIVVFYAASLYPGILISPQEEIKRFSLCTFFAFLGIAISINVETDDRWPIAAALVLGWPFATFLLPIGREFSRFFFGKIKRWGVPAVIYSKGENAIFIIDRLLKNPSFGYTPCLIITDSAVHRMEYKGIPVFFPTGSINRVIEKLGIMVAIVCDYDREREYIQTRYRYMIQIPKQQLFTNMSLHMRDFGGILGFSSTNYLTNHWALAVKRTIDIVICLIVTPLVVPLTVVIAICIKATSKGPVFYAHSRIGKNRSLLRCWKFRSMVADADKELVKILASDPVRAAEWKKERKFTDDPRVTKFGKFLRKTSLDELPQIWNIFMGEMSFVGPRPVTEPELEKYGKYCDYVLSVTPGLSGMWQISGRSDTGYEERITLDTYYIQNWSVWLDLWIMVKTIWVVLRGIGAY